MPALEIIMDYQSLALLILGNFITVTTIGLIILAWLYKRG